MYRIHAFIVLFYLSRIFDHVLVTGIYVVEIISTQSEKDVLILQRVD